MILQLFVGVALGAAAGYALAALRLAYQVRADAERLRHLIHHAAVRDHGTQDGCHTCAELNRETFKLYTGQP